MWFFCERVAPWGEWFSSVPRCCSKSWLFLRLALVFVCLFPSFPTDVFGVRAVPCALVGWDSEGHQVLASGMGISPFYRGGNQLRDGLLLEWICTRSGLQSRNLNWVFL